MFSGDRKHQRLWGSTRPPSEASIQRRLPPQQLVTPARTTFQHHHRPQNSPCGPAQAKPSLPVSLLASGMLLQVPSYGGPLAERDSDARTPSVAGGIPPPPRGCIAWPHFGHPKPTTPKTRHSRALHARQSDFRVGCLDRRRPTVAGLFFAFSGVGRTRDRSRERDARTPCCSPADVHRVRPKPRSGTNAIMRTTRSSRLSSKAVVPALHARFS